MLFLFLALFRRGPLKDIPKFTVGLDRFAINHRSVESTIACLQSFVRAPRITQREFFTDNGVGMLRSAVAAAATVFEESSYEPWALVLPEGYENTVVDLKKANDAVDVRLKNARDTSKGCFGLRSVDSSKVGDPSCRTGV